MPHPLTKRQREYLEFIRGYIRDNEGPPRLQEIADQFGVKSPTAHNMLEKLQVKGYILFGRDSNSGFWIRLVERAGSVETMVDVQILGKLDQFGEVHDFPKSIGHFASVLDGSKPDSVFALVAYKAIPQEAIFIGDALIFDYDLKPRPGDLCLAQFGERILFIRVVSKTYDEVLRSDVVASDYPIPGNFINDDRLRLLNWYPVALTDETKSHFQGILEEAGLEPNQLHPDLVLATVLRLSRQYHF